MNLLLISLLLFQDMDASLIERLGDASFRKRQDAYSVLELKLSLTDGFSQKGTLDAVKAARQHPNMEIAWRAGQLYEASMHRFFSENPCLGVIICGRTSAASDVYYSLRRDGCQVEYICLGYDELHLIIASTMILSQQNIVRIRDLCGGHLLVPIASPCPIPIESMMLKSP